jgi:structural protein
LLQKTYDKLQKLAGPQVLVETTVAKLGKLPMLGDGVTVVAYHPHKFVVHSRVIKRKIDLIDEAYSNLEIGTSNIERQAEREKTIQTDIHTSKAETDKNFSELNQKTDDFYKNLETKINETADEQTRRAQEAIKRVEDDVKEKVESTRAEIDQYINQNSNGPIELIDTNGNFIQGVGKIKEIRSEDGSFVLNSSGFNFGGRLLGGKGKLYADDIVGREITGYTVTGAHIIGGTIDGVTIDGANFIRSTVGGTAVLSGEHGFSHNGDTALGNGMLRLGNQWLDETMLAAIKEKCGV